MAEFYVRGERSGVSYCTPCLGGLILATRIYRVYDVRFNETRKLSGITNTLSLEGDIFDYRVVGIIFPALSQ